jgi:hypothetical protein
MNLAPLLKPRAPPMPVPSNLCRLIDLMPLINLSPANQTDSSLHLRAGGQRRLFLRFGRSDPKWPAPIGVLLAAQRGLEVQSIFLRQSVAAAMRFCAAP